MLADRFSISSLLPNLLNKDEFFEGVTREKSVGLRLWRLCILFTTMTFFYGLVMGCYSGPLQALVAGVKVSVLFFLSLLICFPAFFIIQYILGSTMKLSHPSSFGCSQKRSQATATFSQVSTSLRSISSQKIIVGCIKQGFGLCISASRLRQSESRPICLRTTSNRQWFPTLEGRMRLGYGIIRSSSSASLLKQRGRRRRRSNSCCVTQT